MYKSRSLEDYSRLSPSLAHTISASDFIFACNLSNNLFPVALNCDKKIKYAHRIGLGAYLFVVPNYDNDITLDQIFTYDTYNDSIQCHGWAENNTRINDVMNFCRSFLKRYGIKGGFRISYFQERPKNSGFGFRLIQAVLISHWLLHMKCICGKIEEGADIIDRNDVMVTSHEVYKSMADNKIKEGTFLKSLDLNIKNKIGLDMIVINFGNNIKWDMSGDMLEYFVQRMNVYQDFNHTQRTLSNLAYLIKCDALDSYQKLSQNPYQNNEINAMKNSIDQMNAFVQIVEGNNEIINLIRSMILNLGLSQSRIQVAPMTSSQYGDNIVLSAPKQQARSHLINLCDKIKTTLSCSIDYISRIDETYYQNIETIQNIQEGVKLPHLKYHDCCIRGLNGLSYTHRNCDVDIDYFNYIVVDSISNRISFQGINIDSKIMPSQTYVICMLDCLIENIGKRVSNKDLPASSYSKSMNQMTGKILGPLRRYVKDTLGVSLNLQITGSIYDFNIKLELSDAKIIFIEKL